MPGQALLSGLLSKVGVKQWGSLTADLVFLRLESADRGIQIIDKGLVVSRSGDRILSPCPLRRIISAGSGRTRRVQRIIELFGNPVVKTRGLSER
jgi:hypothetical protein